MLNSLDDIKTGTSLRFRDKHGGNLPTGHAVPGHSGFRAELENLSGDVK
jgi:hypothetical protein